MRRAAEVGLGLTICLTLACASPVESPPLEVAYLSAPADSTGFTPLMDSQLGILYLDQFEASLYPGGYLPPASHDSAARAAGHSIQPRSTAGVAFPAWNNGKIVLLSIGPSNGSKEWCSDATRTSFPPCTKWSFVVAATADAAVQKPRLSIVNGAMGGGAINVWTSSSASEYGIIATRLKSKGLSEKQVQAVWLKIAHNTPTVSLPDTAADAYHLVREGAQAIRAMAVRYPNLRLVFVDGRTYGGYSTTTQNPEPFAYESGLAVKWLIQAQIVQRETGQVDSLAGDMLTGVPTITWGAYLWTDGMKGRSDGLIWTLADVVPLDGMHPSVSGQTKVAGLLMTLFKGSPYSRCWFLAARPAC